MLIASYNGFTWHVKKNDQTKNEHYCMAEGGVFIGRVLKFSSEETDLFPHYRKSFCMAATGTGGSRKSVSYAAGAYPQRTKIPHIGILKIAGQSGSLLIHAVPCDKNNNISK